jgi:hypothetical protein
MKKYISILSLFIYSNKSPAQDCPIGYEERNVKCDGKTVKKCVPVNLSCNKCWHVSYSDCQGNVETSIWGGSFDTYEECVKQAQDFQKNHSFLGNCPQAGSKYLISLLGSKANLCTNSTNSIAINDLKNKILPFLQRFQKLIANYRREINGVPYKPGAVFKEYKSLLDQAEANANKLSAKLNNLTNQVDTQIEQEFENLKNDEQRLIEANSNYKSSINSSTSTTPTTSTTATNTNQQKNIQLQNQLDAINQDYQTKLQNNEQFFNTLQTGIQNIADILAQNAQRKAEERQRQFKAEQQRQQQKLQAQLDEERKRQEEEDRINNEMMRQYSIDSVILSNNNLTRKTSSINSKIDSVYYIGYKRQYDEQQETSLSLKVFVVYRYSDGTFPLFSNVVEKSKFENNINRYGITLLLGFFQSQFEALKALDDIQSNARDSGINSVADKTIRKINFLSTNKTKDENFWNQ